MSLHPAVTIQQFAEYFVSNYNKELLSGWPRMKLDSVLDDSPYEERWLLRSINDPGNDKPPCEPISKDYVNQLTNKNKSGLFTLWSPAWRVPTKPKRREKSQKRKEIIDWQKLVAYTWDHLNKYSAVIDHVHNETSVCTWSRGNRYIQDGEELYVSKIKRLCIAIIHFEEIFHKTIDPTPADPSAHLYYLRNWRDNYILGLQPLTQAQSIHQIAAIEDKAENMDWLLELIEPPDDVDYSWRMRHFQNYDTEKDEGVAFHVPRACTNADDVIRQVELVALFVRAAISCPSEHLQTKKYAPTYQGLAHFLQGNHRPDDFHCRGNRRSGDGETWSSSEGD